MAHRMKDKIIGREEILKVGGQIEGSMWILKAQHNNSYSISIRGNYK